MGLIKPAKAPERYEDIIGGDLGTRLGWFRRLRLIWFFVKHPDEFERYDDDARARRRKLFGRGICKSNVRNLWKATGEIRKEMREVRGKIAAEQRERRRLRLMLDDRKRLFDRVFGVKEVSE